MSKNVSPERKGLSWGWVIFWCAAFSATGYKLGTEDARRNVMADTAHIRDVCLITGDEGCIERALERMENATP